MKMTKEHLESLYKSMSIDDMAISLKIAKSTLYYNMKKLGIKLRSKQDAQKNHLAQHAHQRTGKKHTDETRDKISSGTREFWESNDGEETKQKLRELRQSEWSSRSPKYRNQVLSRLQNGERPVPGSLSKFGKKLAAFLESREKIEVGVQLSSSHVSDIVLTDRKVVLELLLPVSVYGEKQEDKIAARYERLSKEINDMGYKIVIIEDKSNSISNARCKRIYEQLVRFFTDASLQRLHIVS